MFGLGELFTEPVDEVEKIVGYMSQVSLSRLYAPEVSSLPVELNSYAIEEKPTMEELVIRCDRFLTLLSYLLSRFRSEVNEKFFQLRDLCKTQIDRV